MAIYSLHHGAVGRTTHAAGTAGAHARYVTRSGAANDVVGEHMPLGRDAAGAWLNDQEAADRKNARVIDKVMLALPVELDHEQRVQLVRDFAAEVGGGRIPWLAGIHDGREDADNPHAHVIFRDRDIETGKRVAELSGKGSTERLRELWEVKANQALEQAGVDARIDRRSLEDQGLAKEPGIHVGPNVRAMEEKGIRPVSVALEVNGRVVNWPAIDQGRTRADRQREIEAANDDSRDVAGDRGKDQGAPPAGVAAPSRLSSPAAPDLVQEARERWAQHLRELAAQDDATKAQKAAQEAPADVWRDEPKAKQPEAPQRPPQGQQEAISEKSRLAAAIERGWEKLTSLGQRLEAAWERITPLREQPAPNAERLRLDQEPPRRQTAPPEPPPKPEPAAAGARAAPPRERSEPAHSGPKLTPEQGLGKSLNHPLFAHRRSLDGPDLPSL